MSENPPIDLTLEGGLRTTMIQGVVSIPWKTGELPTREDFEKAVQEEIKKLEASFALFSAKRFTPWLFQECRVCGCTEEDCSECIAATGHPCRWIPSLETDAGPVCSRCAEA